MTQPTPIRQHPKPGEEGYMLLAVICLLALLTISMSVAIPAVIKDIQRDRELETMERGQQYIRAVKMYYKKFGAYPPSVEVLVKPVGPGNLRFLRKKYLDPITGKNDWKPIQFGQNKAPTAMGFFGQPLGGIGMAGVGPGGGGGIAGAQTLGSSLTASTDANGTPMGGDSSVTGGDSSTNGSPGNSTSAVPGSTGSSILGGQAFGGLGIIGFSPASSKQSILVYKTKNHYNQWEFVYDPRADFSVIGGGGPAGTQPVPIQGNGSAPGTGGLIGGGSGIGTSPSTGFGSSGSSPTSPSPTNPQP